jgi:hypothetical protein
MSSTAIVQNEESIKQEALTVVEQAKVVRIIDQDTYESACSLLLDQIKPFRKRWAEYWESPKTAAYQAYKAILGKYQEGDEPLARAEAQVKAEISRFDTEQERRRQQLQREAEEAARQKEEQDRLQAATVAEDLGASAEEVEAIANSVMPVVAEPIPMTYQRASGVSTRDAWSARVVDLKKLCAGVAKGTVPISYVEANMTALNARARADRTTMAVPGVIAVNNPTVSGRSR